MHRVFILYWISCLDKSMYVCINKFTYPGFVFCPSNPHPKVNEYHTICCGESGIIYIWEIVDGRNHPITMGIPKFETSSNMKMFGLMIRLTRALFSGGGILVSRVTGILFFYDWVPCHYGGF